MKPIVFNREMVRAILDGRKTITRRVVKPQPEGAHTILGCDPDKRTFEIMCGNGGEGGIFLDWTEDVKAPFWPGDILYVRVTWAKNDNPKSDNFGGYEYRADYLGSLCCDLIDWSPSIHMPKEAARIFLRVTDVRAKRLQDMTNEDAEREGARTDERLEIEEEAGLVGLSTSSLREYFGRHIWDSTIKKKDLTLYGWDANPWVWVIEFERQDENQHE